MTAHPAPHPDRAPRRPLSLVQAGTGSAWRAESVLRQWDPEQQLIGALLHLSAAHAAPILELVPDNAFGRPDDRWVVGRPPHRRGRR